MSSPHSSLSTNNVNTFPKHVFNLHVLFDGIFIALLVYLFPRSSTSCVGMMSLCEELAT